VRCIEVPGRTDALRFLVDTLVVVDPIASELDRMDYCTRCNAWRGIRGRNDYVVAELPAAGFSRTDICGGFGLGPGRPCLRAPDVLVDAPTAEWLGQQNYSGLVLTPVELATSPSG
jgi:hypothetical protein